MNANFLTTASGVLMPKIIYGTAWKKDRTRVLVGQAIKMGFRGIDTACQPKHYHEAGVGEGVATCITNGLVSRSQLYLQTKFTPLDGQDPSRIPYDPDAAINEQVAESFQVSLKNLQTDYLDCLVLHSPLASPKYTVQAWQAMENLARVGRIKQLGISNCYELNTLKELYDNAEIKPAVIQNRFYGKTRYDIDIRAYCKQHGIIYQSFWTLTANPHILAEKTVHNIANEHRRMPAQIFFRYLTQIGIVPLTGTTSPSHMEEDLAIFDFELSQEECIAIDRLF